MDKLNLGIYIDRITDPGGGNFNMQPIQFTAYDLKSQIRTKSLQRSSLQLCMSGIEDEKDFAQQRCLKRFTRPVRAGWNIDIRHKIIFYITHSNGD